MGQRVIQGTKHLQQSNEILATVINTAPTCLHHPLKQPPVLSFTHCLVLM